MPAAERRELRLTLQAEDDLADIWSYGAATWSPEQADHYLDQLFATLDLLLAMPEMARERAEFRPPVRIHPSGSHLIVFLLEAEHLLVVRVLGARQDWQALLTRLDL